MREQRPSQSNGSCYFRQNLGLWCCSRKGGGVRLGAPLEPRGPRPPPPQNQNQRPVPRKRTRSQEQPHNEALPTNAPCSLAAPGAVRLIRRASLGPLDWGRGVAIRRWGTCGWRPETRRDWAAKAVERPPATTRTTPNAKTTGLRSCGTGTTMNTGRGGRQNAATRCGTRRAGTVQGPRTETATRRNVTHEGGGLAQGRGGGFVGESGTFVPRLTPAATAHTPPQTSENLSEQQMQRTKCSRRSGHSPGHGTPGMQ